jgi:tyrosyl-tRNA synthetase
VHRMHVPLTLLPGAAYLCVMSTLPLLDELAWRGLLYQHTEGLAEALTSSVVTGYCGFDPTASSLHVGNLVPVMGLVHLQRAGHRPIAMVGGGTGLIGDPSGRSSERQLLTPEMVAGNTAAIGRQLERFLDFSPAAANGRPPALMRDNAAWLTKVGAIEFMREVGKHFTVNYMLAKDSVKSRIDSGISYTEFSYMLLQAYDFLELYRREGATLQLGGSDQWGNMTAGMELIRRSAGGDAHVFTLPLVTTAAGEKFGKSAGNAIWLDADRTSPYAFYQFWVNADDRDAGAYLRYFTLLPREEIEALESRIVADPSAREAQRALARDVTRRVHGEAAVGAAEEVTGFFFGGGDPRSLSLEALGLLRREAPFAELGEADVRDEVGGGLDVLKLLTATGLADSNGAARRLLQQGGISINRRKLGAEERYVATEQALLAGRHTIIGKGKREFAVVRIV